MLWTKGAYQSTNLVKFHVSSQKSEILYFDELLLSKWYIVSSRKVQKSYLSWHWKTMQSLKKNWLQIWHEEFGKFSPNHSKVWKFHFDGLFLSKISNVWANKLQRSYLLWHWTVMQHLNKPQPCVFKNGMRNWVNLHSRTLKSEKLCFDGFTFGFIFDEEFPRN